MCYLIKNQCSIVDGWSSNDVLYYVRDILDTCNGGPVKSMDHKTDILPIWATYINVVLNETFEPVSLYWKLIRIRYTHLRRIS